ncbi:AAA family ATPase [Lentzea sp. BCCO 10_0856]|uniref:AAA family ATPase n=1 Tax=Lentzea miocenica TaxID=3095431 RepID=A0ABU4TBB1_9PSEU|nr:AAA family ATPase [Lentzea sp. BCCO 10_0856]MDX8035459.1 AAA family ATPase [Lentzea sp. BCCO 10_0856]
MIVTFYSYKGGVGRSFCLANVAVQLARWGNRVLCVDFDLDAPGLHEYFKPYLGGRQVEAGLVEVVSGETHWTRAAIDVDVPEAEFLTLLAAGRMNAGYADRAQTLSWPDLFANQDLGWRFEKIRAEWEENFDYVLIDSRTGITDIGGICTAQLPDVLVLCVAPNLQNLAGALEVAERAAQARDRLPYDRSGLLYLPVVSRFDGKEEYERARSWRTKLAEEFAPLYVSWLPSDQGDDQAELGLVERTTVPYLPYWSFGEEIAVVDERSGSPDSVSYYMDNIAALLAHRLSDADVLVSNRDTYVSAARERGRRETGQGFSYDVLVHGTSEEAVELTTELIEFGVRAVRGRLAELSMVRHFVIVDPPARASAGIQEILDQVQLDPGRLVMVVGDAPKQLSSAHPIAGSAVDVVTAVPAQDMGPHWEGVLVFTAHVLKSRGDLIAAHALAGRALEAAQTPIRATLLRAELAKDLGRVEEAETDLNRVLSLSVSNSFEAQRAHRLLGEIYRDGDDLASAVDHFRAALQAGGSDREQALVHRELARMELREGNTERAVDHLGTARGHAAGDIVLEAQLAFELGSMLLDQGDFDAAGRQLVDAVEWNTLSLDDQVTALRQLAYLESVAGRQHGAEDYLRRAHDLAVRPVDKIDIVIELGRLQRDAFGVDQAIRELSSVRMTLDPGNLIGEARLAETLGNLHFDNDDPESARSAFVEALEIFRRLGDRAGEVRALIGLVSVFRVTDPIQAAQASGDARRLLTRLRGPEADLLRRQLDAVKPK